MKTFYRGSSITFKHSFKDGAPIQPISMDYPKYEIIDSNGTVQAQGVGVLEDSLQGLYKVDYVIPADAAIDNNGGWVVNWIMKGVGGKEYLPQENFSIQDVIPISETRDQLKVAISNKDFTVELVSDIDLDSYAVELYKVGGDVPLQSIVQSNITKTTHNGVFRYMAKFTGVPSSTYIALWTIKEITGGQEEMETKNIECVSLQTFSLVTEVRMLIDKFQKVKGTYQGYEDSDIIQYLKHGSMYVNATFPPTNWTLQPQSPLWNGILPHFVVMAASWYGLTAQHLLENDMAFNHQGLSTTLDMDRTGGIESALARMDAHIKETLPKLKLKLVRDINGPGHVGVRIFGSRYTTQNLTYKIGGSHGSSQTLDYLTAIGVLFL